MTELHPAHVAVLLAVDLLMDAQSNTPEGGLLDALATVLEEYEQGLENRT